MSVLSNTEYQELEDTGLAKREITKVSYQPPVEGEDESSSYEEYYEEGIRSFVLIE